MNPNENKLLIIHIKLTNEITESRGVEIYVFSEIQFDVIIEYYHIDIPILNSIILAKEIKESLFINWLNNLEVINLYLKKMLVENIESMEKDQIIFRNLSKSIK